MKLLTTLKFFVLMQLDNCIDMALLDNIMNVMGNYLLDCFDSFSDTSDLFFLAR